MAHSSRFVFALAFISSRSFSFFWFAMPADHSTPVKYFVRAADGRGYPMFIMTQSDRAGRKNTAEEDAAIIDYVTKPLLNMLRQYHAKMEDLYQARQTKTLKVGDYHPALSNLLYYIGRLRGSVL